MMIQLTSSDNARSMHGTISNVSSEVVILNAVQIAEELVRQGLLVKQAA